MIDWHKIESAPKDRSILLWYDSVDALFHGAIEGEWFEDIVGGGDSGWLTVIGFIGEPLYWAKLNIPSDRQTSN